MTRPACGAVRRVPSRETRGRRVRLIMLRIYETILQVLAELVPVVAKIETHDRDLGRQLRRAATSIVLNTAEACGNTGGTRRERFRSALGSAQESVACIDAAVALGYIEGVEAGLLDKLDHVRAVLVKVAR